MRRSQATAERSIATFLFGCIAFSPPFLAIFGAEALVFGLPLLYFYLFAVWGLIIVMVAWIANLGSEPASHRDGGRNDEPRAGPV